jgi:hypothetical protein
MTTSNEMFDSIVEGQRKMMDWWMETSGKMMDSLKPQTEEKPAGEAFIKDWSKRQQSLLEEVSKMKSPQEAMERAPEQFKKWMELQLDFYNNWMETYKDGLKKMGYNVPDLNGHSPEKMLQSGWKLWNEKVTESTDWVKKNVMDKLPESMQPYYRNFTGMYQDMFGSWELFQRMIKSGVYDSNTMEKFFSPTQYQDLMNKAMGFPSSSNLQDGLLQMNEMFDQYLKSAEQYMPTFGNMEEQWKTFFERLDTTGHNPFIHTALDINHRLKENIEPFINMLGYGKPGKYTQIMKDIQFSYTAFLLRNSEMQNKVYRAGQNALPETVKAFYEEFQESKEMPTFETFFSRFVDNLERSVSEVLESKEYSVLQANVSRLGITVKGKLDELLELSFEETPFLMKSHGDDLAKEIHSLRRKVRDLEKSLKEVRTPAKAKEKPVAKRRNSRAKETAK